MCLFWKLRVARGLGVSVMGDSSMDELDEILGVWYSILQGDPELY